MSTAIDNPTPAPHYSPATDNSGRVAIDNPDLAPTADNPPHVISAADAPARSKTVLNDPRAKSKTMTPHGEPSPPPSPRSETKHPRGTPGGTAPSSKFASHLSSIPLFAAASHAFSSHSPRALHAALCAAQSITHACVPAGILNSADKLADALLTQVEHTFPAVRTPTEEMTARPIQLYERVVVQPATSVRTATRIYSTAARENAVGAYKRYAEPVLAEYTNGPVRRANDRFEEAVEAGMPKSYREAVVERDGAPQDDGGETLELYRSVRLARNALERGRVRFWVPMQSMAGKTEEDVKDGGGVTRSEVKNVPTRVRDGIVYFRRVLDEEVRRERGGDSEQEGRRSVGVKGAGKVMYRVWERCAGEVVGVGLVVVAKATGFLWGMWGLGKKKVKTA